MGNCLMHDSSRLEWGGEDWGPALEPAAKPHNNINGADEKNSEPRRVVANCKEVKLKITKKQLEELVGKLDVQGLTVHQVLEQLIKASSRFESNQMITSSPWRPNLQSIPEFKSFRG